MNDSAPPRISIVTVVFNGETNLAQCLQGVRGQAGASYEHIVIDGGSTDGSLDIIRRHADGLAFWSSERDRGIGDAMNKGIARARGEWLLFLHADDYLLAADSLAACDVWLARSDADIVAFPICFGLPGDFRVRQPRGGDFRLNLKTGIWHQSCFIRRAVFGCIGGYDVQLRIAMDYEFFLRAWRAGVPFESGVAPPPTLMRSTGISSRQDWRSLRRRFQEEQLVHFRHARGGASRLAYRVYWPLYLAYRWMAFQLAGRVRAA